MAKPGSKTSKATSKGSKTKQNKVKTREDDHQNVGEKPTFSHRYQESTTRVYTKAGIYKPILEAEFQSTRYLRTGTDLQAYQC
jgi:hypothetical protein